MLARGDRQHDIALYFGVNGGRIGEIATGDKSRQHQDTGSPFFDGLTGFAGEHGLVEKDLSRGEALTIRWKLDLILLNPPNHTSSIPAAGVNFATSL
jgi:hypothetical protein